MHFILNYSSLICTPTPFFQGIKRDVSWTGVSYSFLIFVSIKRVKVLEIIPCMPFEFRSYYSEPTSRGQRELSMQVKQTIVRLQNQNKSIREMSKPTFKRKIHERKYSGFTTRCKQGQIRLCQKHLKKAKSFLGESLVFIDDVM